MNDRSEYGVASFVREAFFSPGRVCVEVGAGGPDYLSVGAHFRGAFWRVLSVEPNPAFAAAHRDRGHEVAECACAGYDADGVDFTVVDSHGDPYHDGVVTYEAFSSLGLRGPWAEWAARLPGRSYQTISVRVRRLSRLLDEATPPVRRVDVLAVDVEGWEMEVLDGLDWARHRPAVIIMEDWFHDPAYRSRLAGAGYDLFKSLPSNDIYVSR